MDRTQIIAECRERHGKREVSDECARAIVHLHGNRQLPVLAWLVRGELPADDTNPAGQVKVSGETKLYRLMFGNYGRLPKDDRLMADMLGTWLVQHSLSRVGDNWA